MDNRRTARATASPPTVRVDSRCTASSPYGQGYDSAYANYQELQNKKSPIGWWIAGAALVIVIVVVAVLAIRAVTGGDTGTSGGGPVGQPSQDVCPPDETASPDVPVDHPPDGRVHGGPGFPIRSSARHGGRRRVN